MKLHKLNYTDDVTGEVLQHTSRRVEYFFHYWSLLFSQNGFFFDNNYLKSHRTIIEKLRLQVIGNFKHSKKSIKYYFSDDTTFSNDNLIIKGIKDTKERRAVQKIKRLAKTGNGQWDNLKPKTFITQIVTLQKWLDTNYCKLISETLLSLLDKNTKLKESEQEQIKQLTNCFIIELFNKGFNRSYVRNIPDYFFDAAKYPFEKMRSEFPDENSYKEYQKKEWKTMTLKKQLDGLLNLISREPRMRNLIYRVYDVNFRHDPLKVCDVEFYNPNSGFNPKINLALPPKLFEETFTFKPEPYEISSQLNACVEVWGIQEEQMFSKGFEKVKNALSIFNKELNINGKVYPKNVFITNKGFNRIWGSTDALNRGLKAVDKDHVFQNERIDWINQLDYEIEKDKAVLNFVCKLSGLLSQEDHYSPEGMWMILEATFGNELSIKKIFKSIYRLYLHHNFHARAKILLGHSLNPSLSFNHPVFHYELDIKTCEKLELTEDTSDKSLLKFKKKILGIESILDIHLIQELATYIDLYDSNRADFYKQLDQYIDYIISELYSQRNLSLHRNMSDELFLLKQNDLKEMMSIVLNVFLFYYLKPTKRKTIGDIAKIIEKKAQAL
jgi:hypothetical protein